MSFPVITPHRVSLSSSQLEILAEDELVIHTQPLGDSTERLLGLWVVKVGGQLGQRDGDVRVSEDSRVGQHQRLRFEYGIPEQAEIQIDGAGCEFVS